MFTIMLWPQAVTTAPVTWVTPSGLLNPPNPPLITQLLLDHDWSYSLSATSPAVPVVYALRSGALPFGLTLTGSSGLIGGRPTHDPATQPAWVTPAGSLGSFGEGQSFSTTLVANPQGGASSITSYTILPSMMTHVFPYGLTLNPTTGGISGTFANAVDGPLGQASVITWTTNAGSLGSFYEGQSVLLTVAATASATPITYDIVDALDGSFPFGVTLNRSSGAITGTAGSTIENGAFSNATVAPVWTTNAGSLGSVYYNRAITPIPLAATPTVGTITGYEILEVNREDTNTFPFGLLLDESTHNITGTPSLMNPVGVQQFVVRAWNSLGGYADQTLSLDVEYPPVTASPNSGTFVSPVVSGLTLSNSNRTLAWGPGLPTAYQGGLAGATALAGIVGKEYIEYNIADSIVSSYSLVLLLLPVTTPLPIANVTGSYPQYFYVNGSTFGVLPGLGANAVHLNAGSGVVGMCYDPTTNLLAFHVNGVWANGADPVAQTGMFTPTTAGSYTFAVVAAGNASNGLSVTLSAQPLYCPTGYVARVN